MTGRARRRLKIVVAGAGLGGVFAAAALAQAGAEVEVVERAPALGEAGAGIQISPNGARLLRRLGALQAVEARGFRPEAATLRDGRTGATVLRLALGRQAEARWGAPFLQIHRADLLAALEDAARRAGVRFRLGAPIRGLRRDPERAALVLAAGGEAEGDVVLGADGVRSSVREALFGPARPRFLGAVAWRGTVEAARLPKGLVPPDATVWAGAGRHAVTYYLRGGALVNVVAVEERDAWTEEDWRAEGDPAALRSAFAGWAAPVTEALAALERPLLWGLFDRTPPPSWAIGRVALLGDACHPMLPFMAQGAVQAFEDGAALARRLRDAEPDDAPSRLVAYEAARRPRAERVQATSRRNARLYHAGGLAQAARRAPLALGSRLAPGFALSRLDWLYGHEEPG